jgi:uncharacterized protein (TIGR02466 family)
MQSISAWTVPMYLFTWEHHSQYQDQLLAVCEKHQSQARTSGVATSIKSGLYESDFDFLKDPDPAVSAFLDWGRAKVFEAAKDANADRWPAGARIGIDVHESWCHITKAGGYHDMHIHPNSSWSTIYYVSAGESDVPTRSGINRFYSPWSVAYTDIGTRYSSETSSIDIPPSDGTLIVFPSWLSHAATPYQGNTPRVIIAFNCRFVDGGVNV